MLDLRQAAVTGEVDPERFLDGVLEVYAKCPARLHGVGGRASPYRNGWEDGTTDGAAALQIGMQVRIRSSLLDSSRISMREGQPVAIFSPMLLCMACAISSPSLTLF